MNVETGRRKEFFNNLDLNAVHSSHVLSLVCSFRYIYLSQLRDSIESYLIDHLLSSLYS